MNQENTKQLPMAVSVFHNPSSKFRPKFRWEIATIISCQTERFKSFESILPVE